MSSGQSGLINVEDAVKQRYTTAAKQTDSSLCCPVTYDPKYLKVIPQEIIERDYGCGDPSRHVRPGDTVLDLGSGGGKMCFIVSQIVGPKGKVIGIDMNDEMLALARKHRDAVGHAVGWQNVEFRKGRIQDLALDLDRVDQALKARPIDSVARFLEAEQRFTEMRRNEPMVASNSVDVVISNCVLNLVDPSAKEQLFAEVFRVLKPGGRAAIADIVSDRPVPASLMESPELWSGCISGALTETDFLAAFARAGFEPVQILQREQEPWRVVEGIEFRSVTVEALKGKTAPSPAEAGRKFSVWPVLPSQPAANPDSCCSNEKCC